MTNAVIDIIYNLMKVKGVGRVQTNRILLACQRHLTPKLLEDNIRLKLDASKVREFDAYMKMPLALPEDTHFITIADELYPQKLKTVLGLNTPPVLACRGNLNLFLKKHVGFCGARNASEKGLDITCDCVTQLMDKGVSIVSGYAKGVDMVAHKTALDTGAFTTIVLPEGINGFHVRKELRNSWDWNRTLVVSEFAPTDLWTVGRAMQRNKTVVALSEVVIVVEAGETGGSMDAGMNALQVGTGLFVPNYAIVPKSASGNHKLILSGAHPLGRSRITNKSNMEGVFRQIQSSSVTSLF